jgi:hypothetical protein
MITFTNSKSPQKRNPCQVTSAPWPIQLSEHSSLGILITRSTRYQAAKEHIYSNEINALATLDTLVKVLGL